MRAFAGQLQRYGVKYAGEFLSQEEIDKIVASPMERGVYDENGDPIYGSSGW